MSDTDTRETAAQKRARLKAEAEAAANAGNADGDGETEETEDNPGAISLDDIAAYSDVPTEFRETVRPVRARNEAQTAMDEVAVTSYRRWAAEGREGVWNKMPVITYFVQPEQVPGMKKLIRRACEYVAQLIPSEIPEDSSGTRTRFGNAVTLTPELAAKIGHPDKAGKVVLAWCAIDKRKRGADETPQAEANGDADEEDEDEG